MIRRIIAVDINKLNKHPRPKGQYYINFNSFLNSIKYKQVNVLRYNSFDNNLS